jgi:hypothetical protein
MHMIVATNGADYGITRLLLPCRPQQRVIAQWVKELRSGGRAQCTGSLRKAEANNEGWSYCCLGVATELFMPVWWDMDYNSQLLPMPLWSLMGITDSGAFVRRIGDDWHLSSLVYMNDDYRPFGEIATVIEACANPDNNDYWFCERVSSIQSLVLPEAGRHYRDDLDIAIVTIGDERRLAQVQIGGTVYLSYPFDGSPPDDPGRYMSSHDQFGIANLDRIASVSDIDQMVATHWLTIDGTFHEVR